MDVVLSESGLLCFLRHCIARGLLHGKNEPVHNLCSKEFGRDIFRNAMPSDCFLVISTYTRFDDKTTRCQRWAADKFPAIRDLWKSLLSVKTASNSGRSAMWGRFSKPFPIFRKMRHDRVQHLCACQLFWIWRESVRRSRNVSDKRRHFCVSSTGWKTVEEENYSSSDFEALPSRRFKRSCEKTFGGRWTRESRKVSSQSVFTQFSKQGAIVLSCFFQCNNDVHPFLKKNQLSTPVCNFSQRRCGVDTTDQMLRLYSCMTATRLRPLLVFFFNLLDVIVLIASIIARYLQLPKSRNTRELLITVIASVDISSASNRPTTSLCNSNQFNQRRVCCQVCKTNKAKITYQ